MRLPVSKYCFLISLFLLSLPCCLLHAQMKVGHTPISDTAMLNAVPEKDTIRPEPAYGANHFVVREIYVSGNKKTKQYTIERELPFKRGDHVSLPDLVKQFDIARQQLMNTALFHEAVVALKSFSGYNVDILVDVKERWYIFPIPYFKLVDRNLNQWLVEQKGSLDRVNYGLKFTYNNFTGRKDKLKLWLVNGYSRQVQVRYEQPYADKTLKHGYNLGFSYLSNREINYATLDDKQVFVKQSGFIRDLMQINLEYVYRPALKTRHTFRFIYYDETVADTVVKLNPDYFNRNLKRVRFPELSYTLDYQFVDYVPYPQHGFMGDITFSKQGFSNEMNLWQVSAKANFSRKFTPKMSYTLQANASIKLPFDQPFYAKRMIGYGENTLRGLEYYVIDGVASGVLRSTLRRELFNFKLTNPLRSNIDKIPFRIFLKTFGDIGYVYNRHPGQNQLPNRMLYTGGLGVDVVTIYDFVLRIEYSFNQLGQSGIFLHNRNDF